MSEQPHDPKTERVWESIPFGKFKGVPLEDVPTWYLIWFVTNTDNKGNGLYEAVESELWHRQDRD